MDAHAQAALVRNGEATPRDLIVAAIERIERVDPQLNAIIHRRFERALSEAEMVRQDAPFAGVPFVAKDAGCAMAGEPHHVGLGSLKAAAYTASVDSHLARRWRDAGFICLGRTNVPQLLVSVTTEPRCSGATRNPWDPRRSAGGSSGGSAAAVAGGLVPVAHANDSGGSIRMPAAACGLVGLKPTRARVSDGPTLGVTWSGLNHEFALTRTVRDAAGLLDVLAGRAVGDPYAAPPRSRPWLVDARLDPPPLRVRVVSDLARQPVEPQIQRAVRAVADALADIGHDVRDTRIPELEEEGRFGEVMAVAVARDLERLATDAGIAPSLDALEPVPAAMVADGARKSATEHLADIERMHEFARRLEANWSTFDVLLTPTLAALPAEIGLLGPDAASDVYVAGRLARTAFTAAFNASGQPAISLPTGVASDGMPIGVQLVAAYGREDLLLGLSGQIERRIPWDVRCPTVWAGAPT